MMKRKEFMLGATFGLVLAAGATAGGVIDWPTADAGPVGGVSGRLSPDAGGAGLAFAPPQGAPLSFADIFQQVAPAVVQIDVKTRIERPRGGMIPIPNTPFGIPLPQPREGEEEEEGITALGAGSGFFISADGYIVTNNHVVADATEITVRLADSRELVARVVGRDEATDLAVIKVDGSDFPFVTFEQQAQPRVGDWVIAVGNPFGLGGTATAGIVSGQGRSIPDPSAQYVDFLQIDAAINRGNSGGPTFDIYGRVIGVNTAIFSETGGSVGIGFAIPASVAKPITERLMRGESIARGYVGLTLSTPNGSMWESYGLPRDTEGALVTEVTPGAPADRGGVEIGDVITAVNREPVKDSTEATRIVAAVAPGSTIRLDIERNGRRVTANVRAGTRPPEAELRQGLLGRDVEGGSSEEPAAGAEGAAIEGISVTSMTPALRQQYRLPASAAGVVITGVARGTPAARLGLSPGMLITHADRRAVSSASDLRTIVQSVRSSGRPGVVLFVIEAGGSVRVPALLEFGDAE